MLIDIFQNLYDQDTEKLHNPDDIGHPFHLIDTQFKKYVRDHQCTNTRIQKIDTTSGFIEDFENRLTQLENNIRTTIENLMQNDILKYYGCVEIMTNEYSEYQSLAKSIGLIWCKQQGLKMQIGQDRTTYAQALHHTHDNTKAETTTRPYSTDHGGENYGEFSIGVKNLVSIDPRKTNTSTKMGVVQQPRTITFN